MRRVGPAALAVALAGCVHDVSRFPLSESGLGDSPGVPARLVTGHASSLSLFGLPAAGDDSPELAAKRARGRALEGTLAEASVERKITCLVSCRFPLYKHARTSVTATLLRPSGYSEPERESPARRLTARDPLPPVESLYQRLLSLHGRDPEEARRFYGLLKTDARGEVSDYVLAMKGGRTSQDEGYRLADRLPEEESRFVRWFVREFTSLRLEP